MGNGLLRRYLSKLLSNSVSMLVGLAVISFIPSLVGPSSFGNFTYLKRIFTNIFGFLDLGTSAAFITKLSADTRRKELLKFYFLITVVIFLLGSIILISLLTNSIFYDLIVKNINKVLIILIMFYTFLVWFSTVLTKICDAYVLTLLSERIKIGYKALFLILLLSSIFFFNLTIEVFVVLHIITTLIYIIFLNVLLIKNNIISGNIFLINDIQVGLLFKEFYQFCFPLITHSSVLIGINLIDIWLLRKISGSEEVGIFGVALEISGIGFLFTTALSQVITREFSIRYELKEIKSIQKIYESYIPMIFAIGALLFVLFLFQAENLISLLLDERYKNSQTPLILLSIYFAVFSIIKLTSTLYYACNKTKELMKIGVSYMIFGSVLSIILILILQLGALGLALKMLLTELLGVVVLTSFIARVISIKNNKLLLRSALLLLLFIILGLISHLLTFQLATSLYQLVCFSAIFLGLLVITIYWKPKFFNLSRQDLDLLMKCFRK